MLITQWCCWWSRWTRSTMSRNMCLCLFLLFYHQDFMAADMKRERCERFKFSPWELEWKWLLIVVQLMELRLELLVDGKFSLTFLQLQTFSLTLSKNGSTSYWMEDSLYLVSSKGEINVQKKTFLTMATIYNNLIPQYQVTSHLGWWQIKTRKEKGLNQICVCVWMITDPRTR